MRLVFACALAAALLAGASWAPSPARAGDGASASDAGAEHPRSKYYRSGTRVKGYTRRRGGYSYTQEDTINTYGDSRSKYGGASVYRDPALDRQTSAGPFDHGFFFDSAVGARGGDAPYMH